MRIWRRLFGVLALGAILAISAGRATCASRSPDQIRPEYEQATRELESHLAEEREWIDDDPQSPQLLAQQWSLAAEYVAASMNASPQKGAKCIRDALKALTPSSKPHFLRLSPTAFVVDSPGPIGNVFIIAMKTDGKYYAAWNIADRQEVSGEPAAFLAQWRASNARWGDRGKDHPESFGYLGTMMPGADLIALPNDAQGHPRFYVDSTLASVQGGSYGEQFSFWRWDGVTAHHLATHTAEIFFFQNEVIHISGNLIKIREQEFKVFFWCGGCERPDSEWVARITPDGFTVLGEHSLVPEVTALDELFYRLTHKQHASDIASHSAIEAAEDAIKIASDDDESTVLGMVGYWRVRKKDGLRELCFETDDTGTMKFEMKQRGNSLFITDGQVKDVPPGCRQRHTPK